MQLSRRTLARREHVAKRHQLWQAWGVRAQTYLAEAVPPRGGRGGICAFLAFLASMWQAPLRAQAAGQDPAGVVGRTTDFLLNLLMGVGICFIAFGVLSLAISFQSHDDSQKSRAVMAIMGGAIAVSVRYVIQIVAPNAGVSI